MRRKMTQFTIMSIVAALLVQVFVPFFTADTYAASYSKIQATTTNAIDKVMYMAAMEMCVTDQWATDQALKKNVAVGDKITSIFSDQNKEVYVGPIVSNSIVGTTWQEKGYIKCTEALKGLVGDKTITADMLGTTSTDLLSNVYTKTGLTEKTLQCGYYILNWGNAGDATDVYRNSGTPIKYMWPQGYTNVDVGKGDAGKGNDFTKATPITIIFNDEGFVGLEPKNDGIASQFVTDDGYNTSQEVLWGDQNKWCGNVIKYVDAHNMSYGDHAGTGYPYWTGESIHWTDDDKPFNEGWGINIKDGHAAWLKYDNADDAWDGRKGYTYTIGERDASEQYTKVGDGKSNQAGSTLVGNLRELFFTAISGVATQTRDIRGMSAMTYLAKKDGLAYLFYGRYLFNGDGGMPYDAENGGCGAVTVLKDENVSKLPQDKWSETLPYASDVKAYANGSTSTKTDYLSSWSASNGSKKTEVSIFPGDSWSMTDCKEVARQFNAATTTNSSAKNKVLGYMGVAKVNDDGTVTAPDGTVIENPGTVTPTDPEEVAPTCFDGGEALGWILCPLLNSLGKATDTIYQDILQPFLTVDARLFSQDGAGNGTFGAWQMFQGIANIAFVILLLVVIFSQLTGVGIDNYGIKKILPKLIIAAVLINLSYVICQLAVDLSNVLGYGLKGMLDAMAGSDSISLSLTTGVGTSQAVGTTVLTVVIGVLAIGVGAGAVLAGGFAFILPILLALLSAFIAIIFTFVLLGVRQAGVVLLVVLSPLAFVCYMLPNTKKIFDKWLKMFQGLLLFFPICGLLMGAGNLTSRILLSTNSTNFFMMLIAMLLNIVPLFFLPTLLKGAFAAMGNIGAKISGLGKSMSGGLNKRISNSEGYKSTQARMRAGMGRDGKMTKWGERRARLSGTKLGGAALSLGGGKSAVARNRAAYLKQQREDAMTDNLVNGSGFEAALERQKSDVNKEQLENEMALMKESTNNFDVDTMKKELKTLMNGGTMAEGSAEQLRAKALMKKLATSGGYGQKSLASTISDKGVTSMANRKFAAKFMSTDSDVGAAVAKKDGTAAQYMREVNNGTATQGTMEAWKGQQRSSGVTNGQFVADEVVTDDNDFAAQSGSAINSMLGYDESTNTYNTANSTIDNDRLQRIMDNERLMQTADGDAVKAIKAAAASRGITTTAQREQTAQQATQAAQQAANQAQQDAVFDVQRQSLEATHEQNALNRGQETINLGGVIAGRQVTGFAPPRGFDVNSAANVGRNANGEDIVKNADGSKTWNITKGRYEN